MVRQCQRIKQSDRWSTPVNKWINTARLIEMFLKVKKGGGKANRNEFFKIPSILYVFKVKIIFLWHKINKLWLTKFIVINLIFSLPYRMVEERRISWSRPLSGQIISSLTPLTAVCVGLLYWVVWYMRVDITSRNFNIILKKRQYLFLHVSSFNLATDQSNVDVLNKAIQQFTDYTCLKWVPYGSAEANKASYSTYIEFISGRYRRLVSTVSDFVAVTLMFMFVNSCALLQWMLVLCW